MGVTDAGPNDLTTIIQAIARIDVKIENSREQRVEMLARFDGMRADLHAIRNKLNEGMALVYMHEKLLAVQHEQLRQIEVEVQKHDEAIAAALGAKMMGKWAITVMIGGIGLILAYLGLRFGRPV